MNRDVAELWSDALGRAGTVAVAPLIDDIVLDWVASADFDDLLVQTVRSVYPAHEHEQFIAHLRGLVTLWVEDETTRLRI